MLCYGYGSLVGYGLGGAGPVCICVATEISQIDPDTLVQKNPDFDKTFEDNVVLKLPVSFVIRVYVCIPKKVN